MVKIGDNVRFLNATGGGVVRRIDTRNGVVYVEDSDGFETPVLERECVAVPKVSASTNAPVRDFLKKPDEKTANLVEILTENQPETELEIEETEYGDHAEIFLAFFAKNIKEMQTTAHECCLLNDSNYYLFFSILKKQENRFFPIANGILEPNLQQKLADIEKTELNDWENIHIQIIAYKKDKIFDVQRTIDMPLKIDPTQFYKLHTFTENDYFDEPAMLVNITQTIEKQQLIAVSGEEIRQVMLSKQVTSMPSHKKFQKRPKAEIIEIDLHIGELIDTTSGMNSGEILDYQMTKFHETLSAYKDKRGQRIVFIHGKGEGVLRAEIEKQLKNRYPAYYFQDAPFQKYGFGATLVMIR